MLDLIYQYLTETIFNYDNPALDQYALLIDALIPITMIFVLGIIVAIVWRIIASIFDYFKAWF